MELGEWDDAVSVDEMYGYWDYEAAVAVLDRSLDPRSATSLYDTVDSLSLGVDDVILDIGGRDARHSLEMAKQFGCRVVAVDPVEANLERARQAVADHECGNLVEVLAGTIEQIPADGSSFDLVFSRDMLGHVEDADKAFAECVRVLKPGGWMLIHHVFATPLMEAGEAQRLYTDSATVPERMAVHGFEQAVLSAGFTIEDVDVIGSEWAEASQEAGSAPNYLLQVSRLRRTRERLIDELGEHVYRSMYANALYSIYQLIGKLESRVYILRRPET